MSTSHHHHHHRARRRTTRRTDRLDEWPSRLLRPPQDGPAEIGEIGDLADAATFVFDLFECFDTEFALGALILLDENRQVTGVLLDPPTDLTAAITVLMAADFSLPCTEVIMVARRDRLIEAPPSPSDLAGYDAGRSMCRAAGVRWLDLFLANPRQLQSIGIVCDPDTPWSTDSAA